MKISNHYTWQQQLRLKVKVAVVYKDTPLPTMGGAIVGCHQTDYLAPIFQDGIQAVSCLGGSVSAKVERRPQ